MRTLVYCVLAFSFLVGMTDVASAQDSIRVSTFEVDASPPIGSPMAYDPTVEIQSPLSCRGIVIESEEKPIVLCSVDWLGISNGSQTAFKNALAKAAGTSSDRVAIHVIHQHDAPRIDETAEAILAKHGFGKKAYDVPFVHNVIKRAAATLKKSLENSTVVSHLGLGEGVVEKVASNRRILGEDGRVKVTRYTATRDPKIRAMPVGTIDPKLKMISFWNGDQAVAVLTFYATHPQSYYRTGKANPDFPGMARNARQASTGVPHIHFNGAGGNIGAGKWNDGAKENRAVLAGRVEAGMKAAWAATRKTRLKSDGIGWDSIDVQLPVSRFLEKEKLVATLKDKKESFLRHLYAAKHLAWLERSEQKQAVQVSRLKLNQAQALLMPGELFVEYQLAAQKMAPDSFVAMAAYGEYGMGYIGTSIAYSQGGYETSPNASRVGPGSEKALMDAVERLLK